LRGRPSQPAQEIPVIAITLGWLFTLGMAALGAVACTLPIPISRLYGMPIDGAAGAVWVRAAGLRDLGLAAALAVFLSSGDASAAGTVALATAGVALGDFAGIATARGRAALLPLSVHFSGIAMGLLSGALLLD
jgi:hypothetical protein